MAVYTEVGEKDLGAFLLQYDIGEARSCKGVAEGVENSTFLLTTTTGPYILTLYEKRVNPDDLPFFLGLTEHLATSGVPCPTPIKGRDGDALRVLCGRPAAIVSFLTGAWPRRIRAGHCAQAGAALAGMHVAGLSYEGNRQNALGVGAWRALFEMARDGLSAAADLPLSLDMVEIEAEIATLEAHWPKGLAHGTIHADLFPDNVFFHRGRLSGLIDFYFACTDLLAYDLAVCLNAWCFENGREFDGAKARAMTAFYHKRRPLSPAEIAALPLLCRGAAMRFLLTRLYDWINTPAAALVTRKDPLECLRKLRFHRAASGPRAYGLAAEGAG